MRRVLRLAPVLLLAASGASAGEVTVAVAANAAEAVEALAADFEQRTGHRVTVTVGSTGKLYAQILHGAPFDVFLAADQERPRLLVEQGLAVEDSLRTYAIGRLVLWSSDPTIEATPETLRAGSFRRLAIANPDLAPYGAAARDALRALGLWESLRSKIVMGENVGQSFTMAASGNAELGFIALSSVRSPRNGRVGSLWEVPPNLHSPIRQDSVLLDRGGKNPAARDFRLFLQSPKALETIESFGFVVDGQGRHRRAR
ncbi:MAG: molybdate ABC transporter substrate-binding protein [Acidobacteria bacterium]|nr:molybdate ABC transporter substrate-binding protein [Acidobacteriota bacterium]